jgi:hypothetical protein
MGRTEDGYESRTCPAAQMNIGYAIEKFHEAIDVLVTGRWPIHERVRPACHIIHAIRPADLPPELRPYHEWILSQLTSVSPQVTGEDTLQASLRDMDEHTAVAVAQRILRIYDGLVKPFERG